MIKEFFARLASMLKKNFWIKLAAVGFSALLWFFVIAETNPPRTKEYTDIPVSFSGVDVLKEKALCVSGEYNAIISAADLKIEANTDELQYLDENEMSAYVDLSSINSPGEYTLPVRGRTQTGSVTAVEPSSVTFTVEDLITRELPVEVQLTGETNDECYYGTPTLSKDVIDVSGARSLVETYSKAICYIDVTGLTEPTTESRNITLIDSNGNAVVGDNAGEKLPSVIVDFPIYPKQAMDIDANIVKAAVTGVADGYEIKEIIIRPTEVYVAGYIEALSQIDTVTLTPIKLNGATSDVTVTAKVALPSGAAAVSPEEVEVTIKIGVIEEEKKYESLDISAKNIADGYKYTIDPQSIDVRVVGTPEALAEITAQDILPFVDLDGLGEGTHTTTVKFENEPDLGVTLLPEYYTVEVKISR